MSQQEQLIGPQDDAGCGLGRRHFLGGSAAIGGLIASAQLGFSPCAAAAQTTPGASDLLYRLIDAIPDGAKAAGLFAPDGILELPYLYSLGLEPRYVGRAAIAAFYDSLKDLYVDFGFSRAQTRVLIDTPGQLYAEYVTRVTTRGTQRKVRYLFAARMVVEGGRITHLREFLDVLSIARALNPNGLKDLPAFSAEIDSVQPGYRS
ncbi:nuclear transport factor 2 family protein [Janthinobacterium agaricidamnosum]|uniref:Tat (Twin-arginine translocation) pathway signal sequence domain protein n=1 Tax=Janthinobacterium agaricidamnosum NBRC 102515 = DSM 9628 TaxID=1349767 RepID=W0V6X8_9BURK|nr:nuclear transport factor 2 family protein [Janthinobacterium agaricidamnosum]CDG83103.1 tat (twin-arginine translocation) pathway signal sequence domain protein [Janthinobacterium agaricidamnosum NBRC 102515 = DSM 9628]